LFDSLFRTCVHRISNVSIVHLSECLAQIRFYPDHHPCVRLVLDEHCPQAGGRTQGNTPILLLLANLSYESNRI
jgi:hypothetical protein